MRNTLLLASTLALLAPAAFACETLTVGDLSVTHAWSRATIGADRPAVFYVEVTNKGSTTELTPGGFHGMLMGLTAALKEGDSFPVTLTFQRAGDITIDVEVVSMRGTGPSCEDGN